MMRRRTGGAIRLVGLFLAHEGSRPAPLCVCDHPRDMHQAGVGCWFDNPNADGVYQRRQRTPRERVTPPVPCVCTAYNPRRA
jgi:hypothetical protein